MTSVRYYPTSSPRSVSLRLPPSLLASPILTCSQLGVAGSYSGSVALTSLPAGHWSPISKGQLDLSVRLVVALTLWFPVKGILHSKGCSTMCREFWLLHLVLLAHGTEDRAMPYTLQCMARSSHNVSSA